MPQLGGFKVGSVESEFTPLVAGEHALLNNERELSPHSLVENRTVSTK